MGRAIRAMLWLTLAAGLAAAADRPDLGGTWSINDELSDDVLARLRQAQDRAGAGGAGPGGMGGLARERASSGAYDDDDERQALRSWLVRMERSVETLTIDPSARRIRIVDADGAELTLYPDGKKHPRQRPHGPLSTRTTWKGGRLVVERITEQGRKVIETYERTANPPRLRVTVKTKGPRGKLVYRRVYDAADLDAGRAAADN